MIIAFNSKVFMCRCVGKLQPQIKRIDGAVQERFL